MADSIAVEAGNRPPFLIPVLMVGIITSICTTRQVRGAVRGTFYEGENRARRLGLSGFDIMLMDEVVGALKQILGSVLTTLPVIMGIWCCATCV